MRVIYIEDIEAETSFAKRAAKYFAENAKIRIYTDGDIEPGCLMAIRWGKNDDSVFILKLDTYFENIVYTGLINEYNSLTE